MARIALKVDVDTLRGTREGVPRLLRALEATAAQATFLFSLGPDHTGWALRRILQPGFLSKVSRTSVLRHYGLRSLLHGVLLPAPDIGVVAAGSMRSAGLAGHECGIHAWDHVLWQDFVRKRDTDWTRRQMLLAFERYRDIFGEAPVTHGAAGWQMNTAALRQIDEWGMRYASDCRGAVPFLPQVDGETLLHVQIPTTLPTLDELIGTGDIDEGNVAEAILRLTESDLDQVFTLHAELEGNRLGSAFARLLHGWRAQGHALVSLGGLFDALDLAKLPVLSVDWRPIPGRSGRLLAAVPRGTPAR